MGGSISYFVMRCAKLLLRQGVVALPVAFGVVTLTFLLIHVVPGDPVEVMLGDQATSFDREILRQHLGLDQPLFQQYRVYLWGLLRLDWGVSYYSKQPVFWTIVKELPATLELTFVAMFWALLVGVPFGVLAAMYPYGWWNLTVLGIGVLGMSIPRFWLGPLLILLFSIYLDWLPPGGQGGFAHLILPSLSLGLALSAILMRMTRASMLEVIGKDYIRTARAKGLPPIRVYFKHALKNALIPVITIVGLQFGTLLTGSVITEFIFGWPGVGTLFFDAIMSRDYQLVQGCVLFFSLTYVMVNGLADWLYTVVQPQITSPS